MRFLGKSKRRKKGVGSIIGAVFVMLILLSGLTFYATYLSITDHYNETLGSMGDLGRSQNQEKIVIKQITTTASNRLSLTVENQGSVQSHLIWLGVFNKSAVPENQGYYALDEHLNPSERRNIVSNFTVVGGLKYAIQLVTELGNTVQNVFYPASEVRCALSLTAASPTTYAGNNVTVMLTVTHNDTEVDAIQSLTASISVAPSGLVQLVDNSPLTVTGLARGESAFFWWIYNAMGTGTATFNVTYLQAPAGTYALSTVQIVSPPQQGSVTITGVNCTASQNPAQWNLLGSTQNVSGSISDLASNDSSYANFSSYYSGTSTTTAYFPSSYNWSLPTQLVSGTLSNLQADDRVNVTFRSYASQTSAQTLYAHKETTQIAGLTYNLSKLSHADSTGTVISADSGVTPSRILMDKSVYQLTGVSSIPASTWTINYLASNEHGNIVSHGDVDILVRMSNGTIRSPIATNVATSGPITKGYSTVSGAYSWTSYTVFNQTDYLEIDYYIDVTTAKSGWNVYLDIDHNIPDSQQTSATNIILPSEFTSEVELSGMSNTQLWSQLVWTVDSSFSAAGVTATFQLYNYTANAYSTGGSGYITDTIGTANVTETQTITVNATQFRDSSGNWKMKIKGVEATATQFDWIGDLASYQVLTSADACTTEVEFTGASNLQSWTKLVWLVDSSWNTSSVNVTIQVYNYTLGSYPSSGNGYVSYVSNATPYTDELVSQTITSGATQFRNSTSPYYWKVKIKGVKSTSTPFQMRINWIELQDSYAYAGDNVPYKAWVWYTIQATGASGTPIPFTYASLYANGTTVTFQNATDGTPVPNPAWLLLDANGTFQLQIRSMTSFGETFVLYAAVGTVVQQKTITQAAQQ